MKYYQIGDLIFEANLLPDEYHVFEVEQDCFDAKPDRIKIDSCKTEFHIHDAQKVAELNLMNVYKTTEGAYCWIFEQRRKQAYLLVAGDYRSACIYCTLTGSEYSIAIKPLVQAFVECSLVASGKVVLHAACVQVNGCAFAFSGRSGLGKSTRAAKWVDQFAGTWISGDRPLIDPYTGTAYGVPWDGKEQIFSSVFSPLHSIFNTKRSNTTKIYQSTKKQAYQFLVKQIFIPMWDSGLTAKAFVGLNQLIERIPVYVLYCDMTDEAAIETYEILFNYTDRIEKPKEAGMTLKLKPNFDIVQVAEDYMVIPTGEQMASYGGTVSINKVAAFILRNMKDEISRDDLLESILNEYDIERSAAEQDLDMIISKFQKLGLIEEA